MGERTESLKRKLESDDESISYKRANIEKEDIYEQDNVVSTTNLDDLPVELIVIIVSYLKADDLLNVSRCNQRYHEIASEKKLWNKVISVCDGSKSHDDIQKFIHTKTESLALHKTLYNNTDENNLVPDACIGDVFFQTLASLKNLQYLSLKNHTFSSDKFLLQNFPECLKELDLSGTRMIPVETSPVSNLLSNINSILPDIEVVDFSHCDWYNSYFFVSLAKCPKLKVLKLVGWQALTNFIPYVCLACHYGFTTLETLDLRLSNVTDRLMSAFHKIKTLKHIYLEQPSEQSNTGDYQKSYISDIYTTGFGLSNIDPMINEIGVQIIKIPPPECLKASERVVETLVVRNYSRITDITLRHAEKCMKSLKHLDITGTSCTAEQVALFREKRPEVTLVWQPPPPISATIV